MEAGTIPATWQEAFENHSITNVRAFEKQLRASALRDREKLRILVGSNYRDLLSTAEQIVDLGEQSRNAEVSISSLSQACKPPDEYHGATSPSKTVVYTCHVKLADRLLRCASSATRGKSVLLSSKLVVITRLLLKHIEQEFDSVNTTQWLATRLKRCRQQLLACVDNILVRPTTTITQLVQAAAAYCLCTSSSSADAVRHFRTLRAQRLAREPATEGLSRSQLRNDLKQRCHYFIASVSAIKALPARALVELLNNLQRQPILEDQEVFNIETLQLDLIRNLLPSDILSFTPYFKRTTSTASELRTSLQQWVNEVFKHLLEHINVVIKSSSLKAVIKTRQTVLDILLPSCASTLSHEVILTSIRENFSTRITQLLRQQVEDLDLLGSKLTTIVGSAQPSTGTTWQSDLARRMAAQPPQSCLRGIRRSHLGVTENLTDYFERLRAWLLVCRRTRDQIENLSKTRWQDKIEEFEDDEDEEIAQDLATSLSKTDPASYLSAFDNAAHDSADKFISRITDQITQTANNEGPSAAGHITTLLRMTRETIQILSSLLPTHSLALLHTATSTLHRSLAQKTTTTLFENLTASPRANPDFIPPDLPSPSAIQLLKSLCEILSTTGGLDIWTVNATREVKGSVLDAVMGDEERKARFVRSALDEAYLRLALGEGKSGEVGGGSAEGMDADVVRRAGAYWGRTKLLFGVLNP